MNTKRPRWTDEELYHEEEHRISRKESRHERRLAKKLDRSKYKKTDQKKLTSEESLKQPKTEGGKLVRGRVITIVPQGIMVEHDGKTWTCILRGSLKKEKTQAKNLVTVGDFVLFEKTSHEEGAIEYVEPRKSVLSRADNLDQRKRQVIAANVDQVLITASVINPPLKPFLVDRYIIAAQQGGMEPILVINKVDLLRDEKNPEADIERHLFEECLKAYAAVGIKVFPVSVLDREGMEALRQQMTDRVSVFSGQSGVGKSSVINALTGLDLRVGKTVDRTKKGAHTTSYSQLLPLCFGGWCVDTPGIRSFGIWDIHQDELEDYFDEIHETGLNCKFPDCTHTHETGCAVIAAVEAGKISPLRYDSYVTLSKSIAEEHRRR